MGSLAAADFEFASEVSRTIGYGRAPSKGQRKAESNEERPQTNAHGERGVRTGLQSLHLAGRALQ